MPLTSVIIPTHNRPRLLRDAVTSAWSAGTEVEVIVVDDASVDDTAKVCRALTGIKYIRLERNQGTAGARNVGIMESSGIFIAFLDDDDRRLPGSLDAQVKALEANPQAGFACGAMVMADQDYRPTGEVIAPSHPSGDVFWELLELDFPVMPLSTLIRKDCLLRVGLLNSHLDGIDDWDIFTRIAELFPAIVLDQPMGLYRQPTVSSGQGSSARAAQLRRAALHQKQLLKLPRAMSAPAARRRDARRRAINRVADTLLWNAAEQLPHGEYGVVYENIRCALRLKPSRVVRPRAYKKLAKRLFVK